MPIFVANFLKNLSLMPQISCFLPFANEQEGRFTIDTLKADTNVASVSLIDNPFQTKTLRQIASEVATEYILLYTKQFDLQLGYHALTRSFEQDTRGPQTAGICEIIKP